MLDSHEQMDYLDTQMEYIVHHDKGQYMEFKNSDISGIIKYNSNNDTYLIEGQTHAKNIVYRAATPLWRNYSYAGSGLPYPNHSLAYENTSNMGTIHVKNGLFKIELPHPSQYYVDQGKKLLKPHVHLELVDLNKTVTLVLADYLPFRSLTHLPHRPDRTIGR